MTSGSKFLGSLACAFLVIYILFEMTDPIEIVTVLAGTVKMSAAAVDFVKDLWGVAAEGGVIGVIIWIFSGFKKTVQIAPMSKLWDVVAQIFEDNFFYKVPW